MTKKFPAAFYLGLRLIALVSIASSAALAYLQIEQYRQTRAVYPAGMVIAGIPVDGLNLSQAADRLTSAYLTVPLEIHYRGAVIQAAPASLGFSLDFGSMLGQAEVERTRTPFWQGYWDFLWNHPSPPRTIPLAASVSEDKLRAYLKNEISDRLDDAPIPAAPVFGKVAYTPGLAGTRLDIEGAVTALSSALRSRNVRQVDLNFSAVPPARPGLEDLKKMLEQILLLSGYNGTAEIYLSDLRTGQSIQLALDQGQTIPPGIAFTAASTMKIPIMISIFRRQPDPPPPDIQAMLVAMIEYSDNDMSDRLIRDLWMKTSVRSCSPATFKPWGSKTPSWPDISIPARLCSTASSRLPTSVRISQPPRTCTTRPPRRRWENCSKEFTTAPKKTAACSKKLFLTRSPPASASR